MASIQVTEGLLMDLGWEITAKNGRTVSVEPPQDSKFILGRVGVEPLSSLSASLPSAIERVA